RTGRRCRERRGGVGQFRTQRSSQRSWVKLAERVLAVDLEGLLCRREARHELIRWGEESLQSKHARRRRDVEYQERDLGRSLPFPTVKDIRPTAGQGLAGNQLRILCAQRGWGINDLNGESHIAARFLVSTLGVAKDDAR